MQGDPINAGIMVDCVARIKEAMCCAIKEIKERTCGDPTNMGCVNK